MFDYPQSIICFLSPYVQRNTFDSSRLDILNQDLKLLYLTNPILDSL